MEIVGSGPFSFNYQPKTGSLLLFSPFSLIFVMWAGTTS